MEIMFNGKPREVPDIYTVGQLVEDAGMLGHRIAVEVNMEIVPRSRYATARLNPGDRIEIVEAIGGG